jgi:hypothetical protein
MRIESRSPTVTAHRGALHIDAEELNGPTGMLLKSDVALIRKVTGSKFNWPPAEGELVPEVAFDIAMARVREESAGMPSNKLTPASLQNLKRMGVISQEFLDKAREYLRQTTGDDSGGTASTTNTAGASTTNAAGCPLAASTAPSGSPAATGTSPLYL